MSNENKDNEGTFFKSDHPVLGYMPECGWNRSVLIMVALFATVVVIAAISSCVY